MMDKSCENCGVMISPKKTMCSVCDDEVYYNEEVTRILIKDQERTEFVTKVAATCV